MKKVVLLILCTGLLFSSCKKEEETVVVTGNVAPDDETIEDVVVSNYVQKLYISLLGRKSTDAEKDAGIAALKATNVSVESRNTLVSGIIAQEAYFDNEYGIMRADFLHNADSASFQESKIVYEFALTLTVNPIEIAFIQDALERIEPLIALEGNLKNGTVSIKEAHEIIVNNIIYDEVNMGAENYVVSLFQNFLLRYPTVAELESGVDIYRGVPGILFTTSAKNKDELIEVFFDYGEYYEGQVRINYLRFLYREPTDDEIVLLANQYLSSGDYKDLQKYILSLDEYAGLK
ncbi:MAG: hypothetical protein ACJAZ2_002195 [Glaciecola sp.]|jgi:hypothetical protein